MLQSKIVSQRKSEEDIKILKSYLSRMQIQLDQLQSLAETTKADLDSLKYEYVILLSDLQKQNQHNRNLKCQLEDERFFYQKEKEYFCKELASKKQSKQLEKASQFKDNLCYDPVHQKQNECIKQYETEIVNLKNKVEDLQTKLEQHSQLSSTLCQKFLRMKQTRDKISLEYNKLQGEYLKVMAQMMTQLDDTRKEVNMLIDERFQQPLHPSSAVVLQVLQRNSRLMHENSQLRLEIQKVKLSICKTKRQENEILKLGPTRFNPHVIRHYSTSILEKSSRKAEKYSIVKRCTNKSTDENLKEIYANDFGRLPQNLKFCTSNNNEFSIGTIKSPDLSETDCLWAENIHPSRTTSAPEILQTTNFNTSKWTTEDCSNHTINM